MGVIPSVAYWEVRGKPMGFFSVLFSRGLKPRSAGDKASPLAEKPSREPVRGDAAPQIDWRTSEGHQRLLLNFILPNSADSAPKWVNWEEVLCEPWESAVERLKSVGALLSVNEPTWRILHERGSHELKKMCEEHALKASGTKEQMAERLTSVDASGLRLGFGGELLRCSPEAAQIADTKRAEWKRSQLDDSELKNLFTLSEFEAEKVALTKEFLSKGYARPSDDDVKWRLLNKRAIQHAREGNLGHCRNMYLVMANVLGRQNKLKDALRLYLTVCAYDLNGASNRGGLPADMLREFPLFDVTDPTLAPAVVKRVKAIADDLALSAADLRKLYIESTSQTNFPLKWEKTWSVLSLAMEGTIDLTEQPKCFQTIRLLLS